MNQAESDTQRKSRGVCPGSVEMLIHSVFGLVAARDGNDAGRLRQQ
jgi:hypothetical protein